MHIMENKHFTFSGLVLTGEGLEFITFAVKYPEVLLQMLTFSICSAVGQVMNYSYRPASYIVNRFTIKIYAKRFLKSEVNAHFSFLLSLDVHIYDSNKLRSLDVLNIYHNTQVLHYPRVSDIIRTCNE